MASYIKLKKYFDYSKEKSVNTIHDRVTKEYTCGIIDGIEYDMVYEYFSSAPYTSFARVEYTLVIKKPNKDIIVIKENVCRTYEGESPTDYHVSINGVTVQLERGGMPYKLKRMLKKALKPLDKEMVRADKERSKRWKKEYKLGLKKEALERRAHKKRVKEGTAKMYKLFKKWEE